MSKQGSNFESHLDLSAATESKLVRLELLSAYVDGEATPAEARQVQMLLDTEPEFKRQYLHMHQIRQGLQAMPTPQSQSHRQLSNKVFTRLRWKRSKVISMWGGGAIAALFIAGVVSNIPRSGRVEQFASNPVPPVPAEVKTALSNFGQEEVAVVASLNRPPIQIPKLASTDNTP